MEVSNRLSLICNPRNVCMLCKSDTGVKRGVYTLKPLQQYYFQLCPACIDLTGRCPAIKQSVHQMLYQQIIDCKIFPMSYYEIQSFEKNVASEAALKS